jgi:hypothetical protein
MFVLGRKETTGRWVKQHNQEMQTTEVRPDRVVILKFGELNVFNSLL